LRGFEQSERIGGMNDGIRSIRHRSSARPGWYRGVKLQRPVSPPRIALQDLQDAVESAVRKNLSLLKRDN